MIAKTCCPSGYPVLPSSFSFCLTPARSHQNRQAPGCCRCLERSARASQQPGSGPRLPSPILVSPACLHPITSLWVLALRFLVDAYGSTRDSRQLTVLQKHSEVKQL